MPPIDDVFVPKQFEPLYRNEAAYYGFYGGRASSKSYRVADYCLQAALKAPEHVVTGRQYKNSNDLSTKSLYERRIRALGLSAAFKIEATRIYCPPTGAKFSFVGLQRNPDNLRSFDGATITVLEEAQNASSDSIEILRPSVIRTAGMRFIAIWNPRYPDDAVDVMFRGRNVRARTYSAQVNYKHNPYLMTEN